MSPSSKRPWPSRRTAAVGAAAAVAFAAYGSFVPFDLRPLPFADALRLFGGVLSEPFYISRSDVVANVLLAVPASFFLMGALTPDAAPRRSAFVWPAFLTLAVGAALALSLEFGQVFFPGRIVSKSDIVAQIAGTLGGLVAWLLLGRPLTAWLRGHGSTRLSGGQRRLQGALSAYLAFWLVWMWLPLDFSLSPAAVVHKFREGLIVLVPFGGAYESTFDHVWDLLAAALMALPVGVWAMLAAASRGWSRRAVFALSVLFVGGAEFVQILVADRVADVTDVLAGCVGAFLGIWLTIRHNTLPVQPQAANVSTQGSRAAAIATAAWCGVVAFYHWKPFEFDWNLGPAGRRLSEVSLIPLRQYQYETGVQLLAQALLKVGLGVPLGLLLAGALSEYWRGMEYAPALRRAAALGLAVIAFGLVEAGQLFLPARVPDVTDVLFGCVGVAIGQKVAEVFATAAAPRAACSENR